MRLLVLNQLKGRGLEDVFVFSTDNLVGFSQAIETVYLKSRNIKMVSYFK
ncbi:transposase [Anaerococcus sp.]|nr:transposase [Anaerococcus sp.]MDU2599699.1 transposase [Anaerococcus sp.]